MFHSKKTEEEDFSWNIRRKPGKRVARNMLHKHSRLKFKCLVIATWEHIVWLVLMYIDSTGANPVVFQSEGERGLVDKTPARGVHQESSRAHLKTRVKIYFSTKISCSPAWWCTRWSGGGCARWGCSGGRRSPTWRAGPATCRPARGPDSSQSHQASRGRRRSRWTQRLSLSKPQLTQCGLERKTFSLFRQVARHPSQAGSTWTDN